MGYRLTLGLMLASVLLLVHAQAPSMAQVMQNSESPADKPLSAYFLTPETRAMQQDDFTPTGDTFGQRRVQRLFNKMLAQDPAQVVTTPRPWSVSQPGTPNSMKAPKR